MRHVLALPLLLAVFVASSASAQDEKKEAPGPSDLTVRAFRATGPKEPVTMTLACRLNDKLPFGDDFRQDYFGLEMFEFGSGEKLNGMALKANTKLLEALKDGKAHWLTLSVKQGPAAGYGNVTEMKKYIRAAIVPKR